MPSERVQRRIDRLLDQAEEAADRNDWEDVQRLVEGVFRFDPENEDARLFLEAATRDLESIPAASSSTSTPRTSAVTSESPPPSSTPSSFASGRYSVREFLGEGGKKKVYLAHDNTLDRDVAFALIKTEELDETSRERVKREAQAMGRMGTHPAIMPIYDLGEEPVGNSTRPYMVQPVMVGGDVEGLIEEAQGPLDLERAIEIATQTAQGLSFAHGKGIVHRDLKPGNVWLEEDGSAKIGDFGLAVATDRSRLTVEKVMVGTVSYMPPEQAVGGDVTPRADLYSLGAMLYEMCTGRVPFMGDDDIGIISQHINTPPVAPSWHNSQIPKTLDSLILRLLSKDPAERPESADEVVTALGSIDLTVVEESEEESRGSLDSMAGGVFVGRHREMDQLKATFEEVLSGRGRMVTLVGEPGIGKTRTAQELATYASMRGASVLWGRSYEGGGAPPYWPWVQAIRSHVAETEETLLRSQLGSTGPVIGEVVQDIREKLRDLPEPTKIEDPESARFRLFDSISTFIKNISQNQPLVLMLEDLHWADKPSLMLLEFVARELANSKLMIVGNYRDVELNRRHPLSVTLGDLTRERLFERVVLRGLQRHDVERFIEIAAGINPPAALIDTVHAQTEGNPLFVTETVRLLIQEGDIASGQATQSGTTSWEIRIPEGVREVIGRRLDRLSERCNEVLTIAAVIGRQFRFDVLKMLVEDTTENQLLDVMDESLAARIVEELPDEVGHYQFTHALMEETLKSELSANRMVRMHARIAEALEEYYGGNAEEHAAELAEHFAEAEVVLGSVRAAKYLTAAAEHAFAQLSFEDSLAFFERANSLADSLKDDALKAKIGNGLALSMYVNGAPREEFWPFLEEAFYRFVSLGDIENAVAIGHYPIAAYTTQGQLDVYKTALNMAEPGSIDAGWLHTKVAYTLGTMGNQEEARSEGMKAVAIADAKGDSRLGAWAAGRLLPSAMDKLRYDEAQELYDLSVRYLGQIDDPDAATHIHFHGSYLALIRGDSKAATELAEKTLRASIASGATRRMMTGYVVQMVVAGAMGNWAKLKSSADGYKHTGQNRERVAECVELAMAADLGDDSRVAELLPDALERADAIIDLDHYDHERLGFPVLASLVQVGINTDNSDLVQKGRDVLRALIRQSPPWPERQRFLMWYEAVIPLVADRIHTTADLALGPDVVLDRVDTQNGSFWMPQLARHRLLGLQAWTGGDKDAAEAHFSMAIKQCRQARYMPELAWTCRDFSDFLLERSSLGDREKANELQGEAISIANELGMRPLLEKILAKRERLEP